MTGNIVSRRYAKAFFAVGGAKGGDAQAALGTELSALVGSLEGAQDALKFFKNPLFSADEKRKVLGQVAQKLKLSPLVRNFCDLLADKNRLACLPDISQGYTELLDQASGLIRGELVTAVPLSADKQKAIQAKLEKQTGKKLVLTFATDKDILGGIVLKISDRVLDASIKAQLQILKETIKRGE